MSSSVSSLFSISLHLLVYFFLLFNVHVLIERRIHDIFAFKLFGYDSFFLLILSVCLVIAFHYHSLHLLAIFISIILMLGESKLCWNLIIISTILLRIKFVVVSAWLLSCFIICWSWIWRDIVCFGDLIFIWRGRIIYLIFNTVRLSPCILYRFIYIISLVLWFNFLVFFIHIIFVVYFDLIIFDLISNYWSNLISNLSTLIINNRLILCRFVLCRLVFYSRLVLYSRFYSSIVIFIIVLHFAHSQIITITHRICRSWILWWCIYILPRVIRRRIRVNNLRLILNTTTVWIWIRRIIIAICWTCCNWLSWVCRTWRRDNIRFVACTITIDSIAVTTIIIRYSIVWYLSFLKIIFSLLIFVLSSISIFYVLLFFPLISASFLVNILIIVSGCWYWYLLYHALTAN